jgi:hypothetical protein
VPSVELRPDGTYAVPIRDKTSIVWRLRYEESEGLPVLQIKVEQLGARRYYVADVDNIEVPVDL